jgi:hypothetical protein
VSRTHLAEAATRAEREQRARDQLTLARSVAEEAGLPLEDL